MIKVVLFDLDGTLLNRHDSLYLFISDQYERFKQYVSHIQKDEYCSRFIELDHRGYVWKDQVYTQLLKEYNISGLTVERLVEDYVTSFPNFCVPFPNLYEMLDDLKKTYQLGLITNGKGHFQTSNLKALEIETYFSHIFISELEGLSKPDPRLFYRALNRFNVLPDETIYIGDHPENDYLGANQVGIRGVWKKDLFWSKFEAEYVIDDLIDIPVLINKLNSSCIK